MSVNDPRVLVLAGLATFFIVPSVAQVSDDQRARAYFLEAQDSFNQGNYADTLDGLAKTEEALGTTNGRILNLKIKALMKRKEYRKAQAALDLFAARYADEVTLDLYRDTFSFLPKLEEEIEKIRAAEEAEIQAQIAAEEEALHQQEQEDQAALEAEQAVVEAAVKRAVFLRERDHNFYTYISRDLSQAAEPMVMPDGKSYRTVMIGGRRWMAEDMDAETGDYRTDEFPPEDGRSPRLYDWQTAMTVCPAGWHLPTQAEWEALFEQVIADFPETLDGMGGITSDPRYRDWLGVGVHLKKTSYPVENPDRYSPGQDNYGFGTLPSNEFGSVTYWSASKPTRNPDLEDYYRSYEQEFGHSYPRPDWVITYQFRAKNHDIATSDSTRSSNYYAVRCIED